MHFLYNCPFSNRSAMISEERAMNTQQKINLVQLGKIPSRALEILQQVHGNNIKLHTRALRSPIGWKWGARRWKMTPGAGGLQQAALRSTSSKRFMAIVSWLFDLSQVSWTWKRTVFERLSPKIWACGKSAQKSCQDCWMMIRKSTACRCDRTSSRIFKLNQTCFVESSLVMRWIFEYEPETKPQSSQWKSLASSRPKNAR